MKTFKDFMEQIGHVEPSQYTTDYQKSTMVSKRMQNTHAHRELQLRADREQRARIQRLKDIEGNRK